MEQDQKPNGWRVTGQRHTETYNNNGSFEPVVIVSFVTDDGTTGSVTVPETKYTAQNVITRINAFREHEAQIAQLGNG